MFGDSPASFVTAFGATVTGPIGIGGGAGVGGVGVGGVGVGTDGGTGTTGRSGIGGCSCVTAAASGFATGSSVTNSSVVDFFTVCAGGGTAAAPAWGAGAVDVNDGLSSISLEASAFT